MEEEKRYATRMSGRCRIRTDRREWDARAERGSGNEWMRIARGDHEVGSGQQDVV